MMDDSFGSIYWCILQVSLVTAIGIVASLAFTRRRPIVACSVASATVAVVALLTALAPLPVHQWLVVGADLSNVRTTIRSGTPSERSNAELHQDPNPFDHSSMLSIDSRTLMTAIRSLATTANLPVKRRPTTMHVATWCWMIVVVFGLIRLGMGMAFVHRIRRTGMPIDDPQLLQVVSDVSGQFACQTVPEVRVNNSLTSAAIAGWLRPMLILPNDWHQWSDVERRAVIAHEIAHIVRRDSLWRTATACVLALHLGNPLVHWLMRRVMLYQELCADELAATVVGCRAYMRSLSSLAIRQDDQFRSNVRPDVLPVFSGLLSRRIDMLRSREGTGQMTGQGRSMLATIGVTCTLLSAGLAVIATRGLAQPPVEKAKPTVESIPRIALLEASAGHESSVDPTAGMFQRAPLDPSIIPANKYGMIAVRARELLSCSELKFIVPVVTFTASAGLRTVLKSDKAPIDLEAIEYAAGLLYVISGSNVNTPAAEKNRVAFGTGASGVAVKLTQKADLKAWISRYAPDSKHHLVEGRDVFELPLMPALGPIAYWVALRDETTILVNPCNKALTPQTTFAEIFTAMMNFRRAAADAATPENSAAAKETDDKSHWPSAWKRIEGGLGSVVFTKAGIDGLGDAPETENDFEKAAAIVALALVNRCHTFAFGFDIGQSEPQQIGFRIRLVHESHATAMQSRREIQELIALAKTAIPKDDDPSDAASKDDEADTTEFLFARQVMEAAYIDVQDIEDGTADTIIAFTIPLQKFLEMVFSEGSRP